MFLSSFDPAAAAAAMAYGGFPMVAPMPAAGMPVPVGMMVAPQMQVPLQPQAAPYSLPSAVTPPLVMSEASTPADFQPPARESRALPITAPKKEKAIFEPKAAAAVDVSTDKPSDQSEEASGEKKNGDATTDASVEPKGNKISTTSSTAPEETPSASPAVPEKSSIVTPAAPQKETSDSKADNDGKGTSGVSVESRENESSEKPEKAAAAAGGLKGLMSKFF